MRYVSCAAMPERSTIGSRSCTLPRLLDQEAGCAVYPAPDSMAAKIEAEQPTEAAYRPRSAKGSAHWPAIWRRAVVPGPGAAPALPRTTDSIEIEFGGGVRMRITGAIDASTVEVMVASLAKIRRRR